ncbi:serine/threonine protein kinase [Aspergillus ibericus CBS 121593]|uniref:Serine/threonine protein kinase n=1 Tax=Aspergillus ibericus CBS 121593 TaxID=1448316 RepID=A0A395H3B6_9EURO|nr:serine/threonine protein kinase [Aspergillus ibericus CBS 121593]RAL02120.1 serine/threonine protein kinase [Aspergillus ibericus CBS 121593]
MSPTSPISPKSPISQAQLPYFVGTLSEWDPGTRQEYNPLAIYSHQKIYIGRDWKKCQYVVNHAEVSKCHVFIYSVIFDQEDPGHIPPLVYAEDCSSNGTFWNSYPMSGRGGFLLGHGDVLELAIGHFLRFTYPEHVEEHVDPVRAQEMKMIASRYCITPCKLGSGAYGQVYMAYKAIDGQQLACKVIDLRSIRDQIAMRPWTRDGDNEEDPTAARQSELNKFGQKATTQHCHKRLGSILGGIDREAIVLKDLCHPNIISVEKMIHTSFNVYLFLELIPGGDLFSYIQYKGGKLGNIDTAVIVRQILMALDYLHERDIVHRDLKPDNILMTSLVDGCRVVLSDFGCATHNPGRMSEVVGTFDYMAPEMLYYYPDGYTKAVDMWSLGCVTAALLTGSSISCGGSFATASNVTELAKHGGFDRLKTSLRRSNASHRAMNFVLRLLEFIPEDRMTARQGLGHEWFTNPTHDAEFKSLYQRSIRNWLPCRPEEPLIVDISSLVHFNGRKKEQEAASIGSSLEGDAIALCSSSPQQKTSSLEMQQSSWSAEAQSFSSSSRGECLHDIASQTLSDPDLPSLSV